jgi:phosphotransferase system  glucose/maltose/N-acetylglucosamine-specific IIC component
MLLAELDLELKILAMAGVFDVNLTEVAQPAEFGVNLTGVAQPAEFGVNLMGPRVPVQPGLHMGASLMVMTVLYLLESKGLTVPLQMYCPPA